MHTTYLEYVDEHGRKVRVTVSGHWVDLRNQTAALIMAALPTAGLGLSDVEDVDERQ